MATSTFGEAFRAARAAGDKTFTWNGKSYTTELASTRSKVGQPIASPQDSERGRTRGRPAEKPEYDNEGRRTPMSMPQDAEAGMSRGTRNYAGAGRGGQGGPSMDDYVAGPVGRYDAGAGRGIRGTAADESGYKKGGSVKVKTYKAGGRVTGYKGYGIAKKV